MAISYAMIIAFNMTLLILLMLMLYTWIAFPLLVIAFSSHKKSTAATVEEGDDGLTPGLSVILAAFNEAPVIAGRIQNLLDVEYPPDRITILVGTDGCTDDTARIARLAAAAAPRVIIHEFPVNRGKVSVLRDLVAQASHPAAVPPTLLVFTDANTRFRPDALRHLVRHFREPHVGGVCGRLQFKSTTGGEELTYWNLETALKQSESILDSCLGANGAIYAIRPALFWHDIPSSTIVDDFVIGMKVREAGFRMLYDPDALAEEELPDIRDEWCRRIRIGSGDYQAAVLCKKCLLPKFKIFAWCFWSHKIMRWFTPHILLLTALTAAVACVTSLATHASFTLSFPACAVSAAILLFLLAAKVGRLARCRPDRGVPLRLCGICDHFLTMQAALLVGFFRFCRGNLSGAWTRTPRHLSE